MNVNEIKPVETFAFYISRIKCDLLIELQLQTETRASSIRAHVLDMQRHHFHKERSVCKVCERTSDSF